MTFDHTRFANDLAGMPLRDLVRLYKHCLPHNLDLDAILQAIHQNGLELKLIDRTWSLKNPHPSGPVMTFADNTYAVFLVDPDRRSQAAIQNFRHFDQAAMYKLDLIINHIQAAARLSKLMCGNNPNSNQT